MHALNNINPIGSEIYSDFTALPVRELLNSIYPHQYLTTHSLRHAVLDGMTMKRSDEAQHQYPVHVISDPSPPPPPSVIPSTAELQSSPLLMSNPVSTVVSDYINKLSFIYGPSRPSMFNPYVKVGFY
eukprot:sb/3475386/